MTYSFDGYNYVIKLQKGEQLQDALERFAEETKIEGGWISALGGALAVTLGFYDLEVKEYIWKEFSGLREVVSLTGNIARDEEGSAAFHMHGVFGDAACKTIGGHVKNLTAGATLEIFVHRMWKPLTRSLDTEVGLRTLDFKA